jgi:hypothetical protein
MRRISGIAKSIRNGRLLRSSTDANTNSMNLPHAKCQSRELSISCALYPGRPAHVPREYGIHHAIGIGWVLELGLALLNKSLWWLCLQCPSKRMGCPLRKWSPLKILRQIVKNCKFSPLNSPMFWLRWSQCLETYSRLPAPSVRSVPIIISLHETRQVWPSYSFPPLTGWIPWQSQTHPFTMVLSRPGRRPDNITPHLLSKL